MDLVGPAYAKDILYSARAVDDRDGLAMGLIQRLLPPDQLPPLEHPELYGFAVGEGREG